MSNFFVKLIKNPFVINLLLVIVVSCGVVYGVLAWLDSYYPCVGGVCFLPPAIIKRWSFRT